ncbi:MAG: AAA family ATPase [Chloroflexi bacterium]|nr:AAA family ATPase [Chloroflexota bacterium]
MKATVLHIENLLGFDDFTLDIKDGVQFLIGPNGGGKTSIVRAVDLVRKALDSIGSFSPQLRTIAETVLRGFAAARHVSEPQRPSSVSLTVDFDRPDERQLFTAFIHAAVHTTLLQSTGHEGWKQLLSSWVEQQKLTPLFQGTIVLHHAGPPHLPWEIRYDFCHNSQEYSWDLLQQNITARGNNTGGSHGYLPLSQAVFGSSTPPSLLPAPPSSLPSFTLDMLCPQQGTAPAIAVGSQGYDERLEPFRRLNEVLGISQRALSGRSVTLAGILCWLLNDGLIILGEQPRGLGPGGAPVRQAGWHSPEELAAPLYGHEPWQLPARLFRLKNGTAEQRCRFKSIQQTFEQLAPRRSCDVTFEMFPLTNPAATGAGQEIAASGNPSSPPAAHITVVVKRTDGPSPPELPIEFHGSGTWEALILAEILKAPGKLVILDEPALSLHPTWQRVFRNRLRPTGNQNTQPSSQFLVITHSAHLLPLKNKDDLARLVRIENESGSIHPHCLPANLLDDGKVAKLTKELSSSTDAVASLFARHVVLLEGDTELGLFPTWFEKAAEAKKLSTPEALDLAFYAVNGYKNFGNFVTLLHALKIPWVIISDGAALNITGGTSIFHQVRDAGVNSSALEGFLQCASPGMSPELFDRARALGEQLGIFTHASGWQTGRQNNNESLEATLERVAPGKLTAASEAVGGSKVRQGRWIAENVPCPPEFQCLYTKLVTKLGGCDGRCDQGQSSLQTGSTCPVP